MITRIILYLTNLLVVLLMSHTLLAQIKYSGFVLSAKTEEPIEGATITTNTGEQAVSNKDGYFSLVALKKINSLIFKHIGYEATLIKEIVPESEIKVFLVPTLATLKEVVITGYESNRPLLQTAGAINLIERETIERFDESSIVRAVNTVPGVRMEERAPASYRLSIRGSTLRSPYGIRNVKVYYDGVPFTESNGITALNVLDAASIYRIEVLKGPAGSIYGAGTGGTVLLEPFRESVGEKHIQLSTTIGSYGLKRQTATVNIGSENSSILVQYAHQQYDGYREQSAMDRNVLLISSKLKPSEQRAVTANIIYSNLYYELPGGLTKEQYDLNPKQARGGMFGSIKQNASLDLEGVTIGLKQDYRFSDQLQNNTSIYGLYKFKDNPFNTDYERNTNQEWGARSVFKYSATVGNLASTFTFGSEFQRGFEAARTYSNNGGVPGELRTDDEVISKTGLLFTQAEVELPAQIIATAALSLNDTRYKITRLKQVSSSNYKFERDFKTVLSPRLALLKQVSGSFSVFASISSGFSPPTEEEILTSDGTLNKDLESERGTNYEIGMKGFAIQGKLNFDVTAFYFKLKETIVSQQDVSSVSVFRNVGSTNQKGVETSVVYTFLDQPDQNISVLKTWGSYTYNHFRFEDYKKDGKDFSGNELTGAAPHMLTAGLDISTRIGLYLNLTTNYVSEIPLNDENSVYAASYHIIGARVGFKRQLLKRWKMEGFIGAENLTDEKYSLGNDLNAFGGRYFQPAPDLNFYGGVKVTFKL